MKSPPIVAKKSPIPTELQIINELRAIMSRSDLDNLTCGDVCLHMAVIYGPSKAERVCRVNTLRAVFSHGKQHTSGENGGCHIGMIYDLLMCCLAYDIGPSGAGADFQPGPKCLQKVH